MRRANPILFCLMMLALMDPNMGVLLGADSRLCKGKLYQLLSN